MGGAWSEVGVASSVWPRPLVAPIAAIGRLSPYRLPIAALWPLSPPTDPMQPLTDPL